MRRTRLPAWGLALAAGLLGSTPVAGALTGDLTEPLSVPDACGGGGEVHFTLAVTGDTFPHENIQAVGEQQGYDVLFDHVRPYLQAADLGYTNFDGAMVEGAGYTGYPLFNYNPALASALKGAGIGLVSTANNHILDRGPDGLDTTLDVLDRNGIAQHGTVRSDAATRSDYLEVELTRGQTTVSIGFVSATWGTNGIPDPHGQVNLLYDSNDYAQQGGLRQEVRDAIAAADRDTDVVVVAAHFGFEYQFYPDRTQVEAARGMAEAGADVILGAQPHTLQPVDVIEVGDRRTWVFYSLANFLAAQGARQAESYAATSAIFYIGLAAEKDGDVRVTGYRYLPTVHVDSDTRPAPIEPGALPDVIEHVRTILRDPTGARQVPVAAPPAGTMIWVCPEEAVASPEPPATPTPSEATTPEPSVSPSPSPTVRPTDEPSAASTRQPVGATWVLVVGATVLAALVLVVVVGSRRMRRRPGPGT